MSTLFDLPFDTPEPPAALPGPRIFTVTELTTAIRQLLETSFVEVLVEGEVSNCRLWNTGHLYFTLKDGAAQIKAVMFRSAVRYLRFRTEDGLHVVARGRVSVYDPKGEYQLVCEHLEPHGHGARQLAFEQLKHRLQSEGLFDAARKRPLPALPRKVGIVTSLDGAALRDVIKVLRRRYPNVHLVIRPSRVQGEGAADEIARAVEQVGRVPAVDVLIVGRGGGSAEDLWAFNEERVARALAAAPVPVISAVGHETDVTIADFVADVRAPTPSAAAELVVARKDEFSSRIDALATRVRGCLHVAVERRRQRVHVLASRRGLSAWPARLAMLGRHVDEATHALRRTTGVRLARAERWLQHLRLRLESSDQRRRLTLVRARLSGADERLRTAAAGAREAARSRLRMRAAQLETLSPLAVLARGYAVCWTADRTAVVRHASAVASGDQIRVTLYDGELSCEVRSHSFDAGLRKPED